MNAVVLRATKRLGEITVLSELYHEARLRRAKRAHASPVLVYQMGKVGSRTVVDALRAAGIGRPVYHVHFLHQPNVDRARQLLRERYGRRYNANRWCLYESRFVIRHHLPAHLRTGFKVISLVRDPVARNLSSFFHNLDWFIPNWQVLHDAGRLDAAAIEREYLRTFHEHRLPATWFDDEMKSVFGIDVCADDVERSEDGRVFSYRREDVDLIVLRTEDLGAVAHTALGRFLDIDRLRLRQVNVAGTKPYGGVYRDFMEQARLPASYVDEQYETAVVRFFYRPDEIARWRARWTGA